MKTRGNSRKHETLPPLFREPSVRLIIDTVIDNDTDNR